MFLDKKFIGQKLKVYRKQVSLSQEQIAEKAGLAEKHYGRLERGACMPTLETFFKLITVLNIPLSEFGMQINESQININREKIIKEIYSSDENELELYSNLINSVKVYNNKK